MNSPFKYDENIIKEFDIKAEHELELQEKLGYVRAQRDEIKKFLWRERTELLLAEAQAKSDVEALAAKAKGDIASHRSNLKGIIASLDILNKLVKEIESTITK